MPIRKFKSSHMSVMFEKLNLEQLKKCGETTELAKRLIGHSKKLTQESQELIDQLRHKRKRPKPR